MSDDKIISVSFNDPDTILNFEFLHIWFITKLSVFDRTVLMWMIATLRRRGITDIDKETLCTLSCKDERTILRSISTFVKVGILDRSRKNKVYTYAVNVSKIVELAEKDDSWEMCRSTFTTTFRPLTLPMMPGKTVAEANLEAFDNMEKDKIHLGNKRAKPLAEVQETDQEERKAYIEKFYSELGLSCLAKFKSLYAVMQFTEYNISLYKYVEKIRDIKNPHIANPIRFEETLVNFIAQIKEGTLFRGQDKGVFYKRNVLTSWFKNINRPKFAQCIKGVSKKLADTLAQYPGFEDRAIAIFKAAKDQNFRHRDKLWLVFDCDGTPLVPHPVKEQQVYENYPLYDEKKYT